MLEQIACGTVLYEIIYDKEPYILDWSVKEYEPLGYCVYLPDKFIGQRHIREELMGSVFFFTYFDAKNHIDSIKK